MKNNPELMIPVGYKCCSKKECCCAKNGPVQPDTEQYFERRMDGKVQRLRGTCRACKNFYSEIYRQSPKGKVYRKQYMEHPDRKMRYEAQKKAWEQSEKGKATKQHYRNNPINKAKAKELQKIYRNTPERKLKQQSYNRIYHATHKRTEKDKAYQREYNKTQKVKNYQWKWRRTPRGRELLSAAFHRRRTRKLAIPSSFTEVDWNRALCYFEYRCAICGVYPNKKVTLAKDHWIPITSTNCPGTIPSNIVPLCHGENGCNNRKGSRDALEWLISSYGVDKANHICARINHYFRLTIDQATS